MQNDLWAQIVELHNETKALFLFAEEIEHEQFQDFTPPISEQRHAWEHVVRAKANQYGLDENTPNKEYQDDCLRKALGHEYRAFFDCADWVGIILRDDILKTLKPHGTSCIQAVLPDYYTKSRADIMKMSVGIAEIRGKKDVSKPEQILQEVSDYKNIIKKIHAIHEQILNAVPALGDYTARERAAERRKWIWGVATPVLVATIVGICTFFLGRWTLNDADSMPSKIRHEESSTPENL